jgi:hypothetical protein
MYDETYMTIPPGAILPGAMPKFKIFFLSPEGHYVLWALEGNKVTSEQLDKLTNGGLMRFISIWKKISNMKNILKPTWEKSLKMK